jgi:hypothetical protein
VRSGKEWMDEINYNKFHVRRCKEREKEVRKPKKSCNKAPRMSIYRPIP